MPFLKRTSWLESQAALPVTCKPVPMALWCAYKAQDFPWSQNKGQFPGLAGCMWRTLVVPPFLTILTSKPQTADEVWCTLWSLSGLQGISQSQGYLGSTGCWTLRISEFPQNVCTHPLWSKGTHNIMKPRSTVTRYKRPVGLADT